MDSRDQFQLESNLSILHRKIINGTLSNSLIVCQILSFSTEADLLAFRLVNRLFHSQATTRLCRVQHKFYINLTTERRLNEFIALMQTRLNAAEPNSFPFSAFVLDLSNSDQSLLRFVTEAGQHTRRLKIMSSSVKDRSCRFLFSNYIFNLLSNWGMITRCFEQKLMFLLSRTPNLVSIVVLTKNPIHIPNRDLEILPKSLPRLRVISVNSKLNKIVTDPPNTISLLALLVSRAERLTKVGYVKLDNSNVNFREDRGLNLIRSVLQSHSQNPPLLDIDRLAVMPSTVSLVSELKKIDLSVGKLRVIISPFRRNIRAIDYSTCYFLTWLESLSPSLRSLDLTTNFDIGPQALLEFAIPPLNELTELKLTHVGSELGTGSSTSNLIIDFRYPLIPNPFPLLRKFDLTVEQGPNSDPILTFLGSPMPSVRVFSFSAERSELELTSWHQLFPDLTSLGFTPRKNVDIARKNLTYILRHFPGIKCLELNFSFLDPQDADFWDILTGGATRPPTCVINGILGQEFSELEQPVDGVFAVASLGNLIALNALTVYLKCHSNLDAIVFMTRVGRLKPLKKLNLGCLKGLNTKVAKTGVYSVLTKIHTEVCAYGDPAMRFKIDEDIDD